MVKELRELGISFVEYKEWEEGFRETYEVVETLDEGYEFTKGEDIPVRTYC